MIRIAEKTVAVAIFLVLSAAPAAAFCSRDQLVGKWALSGSDNAKWVRCTFTVGDDGAYSGRCKGTGRPARGNAIDGTLRVNRSCVLSGTHRSGTQVAGQRLTGNLSEDGSTGAGILHFGTSSQNFGNLFAITRKP